MRGSISFVYFLEGNVPGWALCSSEMLQHEAGGRRANSVRFYDLELLTLSPFLCRSKCQERATSRVIAITIVFNTNRRDCIGGDSQP